MIRTLALAALAAISFAGSAGAQTWTPVADSPRGVDAVTAEWPSGVQMAVRCTRGRDLDVMITLGRPVAQPHVAVTVTFGDEEPLEQLWRLSEDGSVLFARQPRRMARALADHREAAIELAPRQGPRHRYDLNAPTNDENLARVLTGCRYRGAAFPALGAHLSNTDWAQGPNADDLERLYPSQAAENRIPGEGTIECRVAADGRLEDCLILSESPPGMGFGAATVALFERSRLNPRGRNGRFDGEQLIRIPVQWRMN